MTEIVSKSASIAKLIRNMGDYRGSPPKTMQATYDFIDEVMNNKIDLVDPTSPFVLGLEIGATQAADAINQGLILTRKSYVGLAQTNDEIYRHMTDEEYLGRFSTPGKAPFTFMVELNSLLNSMVYDSVENCKKAIIPRDTYHVVDGIYFTHEYPIVFRLFNNDVIQITYDTQYLSPITTPTNNFIPFRIRQGTDQVKWVYFTIDVKQIRLESLAISITNTAIFDKTIEFADMFLYARVFNKSSSTGNQWVEMRTTHSDQVFDNATPTAILKVTDKFLNVNIPYIYVKTGLVSGSIRVDLYTSRGDVTINLGTYNAEAYTMKLRAIDESRDLNAYTNAWSSITAKAFSLDQLLGGKNSISFDELKSKITNYAFGKFNTPITPAQLDTAGEENGFEIVRNTDSLTDRYILGIRPIPEIAVTDVDNNTQRLLSRANIGMIRFASEFEDLQNSDNVVNNGSRSTLLSNTVFSLENGIATMVEQSAIDTIKAKTSAQLVQEVNKVNYASTPYYYVFDLQNNLLSIRPYDLDHPDASDLSFVRQNISLKLVVNTNSYSLVKINTGYRLTIETISGAIYKQLNDNQVGVQLRLTNEDESLTGTINGVQIGLTESGERIYQFDIETSYDVNETHHVEIVNAYNSDGLVSNFFVDLESGVDILYTTTNLTVGFVADATDALVNKSQLPNGSVGNSHDKMNLFFGVYLEHLWSRIRSYATGSTYQTSPVNVPARYTEDVYEENPVTHSMLFFDGPGGAPNYHKLHNFGDLVLNIGAVPGISGHTKVQGYGVPSNSVGANGNYYINKDNGDYYGPKAGGVWPGTKLLTIPPTYKYRIGDPVLDNNGNPIVINSVGAKNDFDILVIDGKLEFVTNPIYLEYKSQIIKLMTQWIVTDVLTIQNRLIERTNIFFYPQSSLGVTKIISNGVNTQYINSEQSLTVTVLVTQAVLDDLDVQSTMLATISRFLDTQIRELRFTVSVLQDKLRAELGTNALGVNISGLGGIENYQAVNVSDEHNRLCVRRKLVAQTDNSIIIEPDISVLFRKF